MKIYLGADHGGFKLKEKIKKVLSELNVTFKDTTPEFIEGDDYPPYAEKVGAMVVKKKAKGILICGTGVGVCIAANKVPGVRAVLCYDEKTAVSSRKHDNTNILTLSGWKNYKDLKRLIKAWLNTKFDGGRHLRRLKKVTEIEKKYSK